MNKKVLVVEDDIFIREFLHELLSYHNIEVAEAEDGNVALEYLKVKSPKDLPDLILLDVRMPVKDGFGFRDDQLSIPRLANIPVIVMTSDGGLQEKCDRMHADGSLQKPLNIKAIFKVIDPFLTAS